MPQSAWDTQAVVAAAAGGFSNPPVNPKDYGAIGDGNSHPIQQSDINANQNKWMGKAARTLTDVTMTSGNNTNISSISGNFTSSDIGARVTGTGIPNNTYIRYINSSTSIGVNNAPTVTGTNMTIQVGDYAVGDEWDYVGLQEAIHAAFFYNRSIPHGTRTDASVPGQSTWLNRSIHVPSGNYQVNKAPLLWHASGVYVYGDGTLATIITATQPNVPAFATDGIWYGTFSQMSFYCLPSAGGGTFAVFELQGGVIGQPSYMGVQGISFRDCTFYGGGQATGRYILVNITNNSISNPQGDTIKFTRCHFSQPSYGGIGCYIGQANVIGVNFDICNFLICDTGIRVNQGSINVFGCIFEPSFVSQVKYDGYNVYLSPASDRQCVVLGCRSEGPKQLFTSNSYGVTWERNVADLGAPQGYWSANHTFNQGDIVRGITPGGGGLGNGHVFIAWQGGQTGGTEPTWRNYNNVPVLDTTQPDFGYTAQMAYNSTTLNISPNGGFSASTDVGKGVIVTGAGAGGADLYATISSVIDGSHVVLNVPCANTNGVTNTRYLADNLVTDNAVRWMHFEYYEVNGTVTGAQTRFVGNTFLFGAVNISGSFQDNTFARYDSMYLVASSSVYSTSAVARGLWAQNICTPNGGYNSGYGVPTPYIPFSNTLSGAFTDVFALINTPLHFLGGSGAIPYGVVGVRRGDGMYTTDPNQTIYHNVLGIIGTLGKVVQSGTNILGQDLNIQSGLGTGNQGSGAINFRVQKPGTSGSSVPDPSLILTLTQSRVAVQPNFPLRFNGSTFASLPSNAIGDMALINDCTVTTGNVTVGGGTHANICVNNGTAWVVLMNLT